MLTEVAPGIHRVGEQVVNSYLVEDAGELVIVDAGTPGYWADLVEGLATLGRSFDDVRAVLLTHGHPDHVGCAERVRQRGVPVHVQELDAALARGEVPNDVHIAGPIRPVPFIQFLLFSARRGLFRVPKIREVITFGDGATLDVPGSPRVIHVPGHTAGNSALHFGGLDALFVGDAINTYAVTSGRAGPQLSPFNADRAQAMESLRRLEDVEASLVLPGHGAPWRGGVRAAIDGARAADAGRSAPR